MQPNAVMNVLVIEDDEDDYVLAQGMLSGKAFHLAWAQSVNAALKHLAENQVDVVLLDLSLTDSRGIDAVQSVSTHNKEVPIVVLTGLEDEKIAADALHCGAQDYLVKGKITTDLIEKSLRYSVLRKQSENYARRISLFEQREDFVAMLAHDLKNPICGSSRILELFSTGELGPLSSEQLAVIEQLRNSNNRLLGLIHALLDAYRYETGNIELALEQANLAAIVKAAMQEFAPLAKDKQIAIKLDASDGIPSILADDSSLYRVIQNLLHNAIKFSQPGGTVKIRLYESGGSAVLDVHNDGPTISLEDQARLFERFWQGVPGKRYTAGTGLGLYLCKHIIDAHHGHIACTSKEDIGTTFTVTIPLSDMAISPMKTGSTSGTK
jgi:signal transduction histidine kinase